MLLMAKIESKEAKGFVLHFGMRDGTKGFLKFEDCGSDHSRIKEGQLVPVLTKKVISSSKVVKCQLLTQTNSESCVQQLEGEDM